eukprot:1161262-Pelagomonas_calceolata.AAC.10
MLRGIVLLAKLQKHQRHSMCFVAYGMTSAKRCFVACSKSDLACTEQSHKMGPTHVQGDMEGYSLWKEWHSTHQSV